MRTWFLGPTVTVLLFAACGDDDERAPPRGGVPDSAIAETGTPDAARESSPASDGSPGDTSLVDAPASDSATDSTADSATTDASADAGTDVGAGADSSTDATPDGSADAGPDASGFAIDSLFDKASGANTYGGLNANNWVASGTLITANAGVEWFGSGNGNASGTFANLSIKQNLGGVVENKPYTVSFYLSQPDPNQIGVELADFSKLRIGGPNGTVVWTSTVTPTVEDVWIKWTGTYTPVAGDVGGPFYFEATFDLDAKHSVGFDGPITAIP